MRHREMYMRSSFSRNLCKVRGLRPRLAVSWSPRLWTSLKPGLVGSQRLWCCAQQLSAVDHQFLVVVCVSSCCSLCFWYICVVACASGLGQR